MLPPATRGTSERSHPSPLLREPPSHKGMRANDCLAKAGNGVLGLNLRHRLRFGGLVVQARRMRTCKVFFEKDKKPPKTLTDER